MPSNKKQLEQINESLLHAKRKFLLNLCLFTSVACTVIYLYTSNQEDDSIKETTIQGAEKVLNLRELANLKGQMLALSEYPGTVPAYEVDWVMKSSKQQVKRYFANQCLSQDELKALTQAFFEGYSDRFNDYYDSHIAQEMGYKYGLKFNPMLHGFYPGTALKLLESNRKRLAAEFNIKDEAQWGLFCQAFDKGLIKGYDVILDGVTVKSRRDQIRLFDD
jgi:hypothetical protein